MYFYVIPFFSPLKSGTRASLRHESVTAFNVFTKTHTYYDDVIILKYCRSSSQTHLDIITSLNLLFGDRWRILYRWNRIYPLKYFEVANVYRINPEQSSQKLEYIIIIIILNSMSTGMRLRNGKMIRCLGDGEGTPEAGASFQLFLGGGQNFFLFFNATGLLKNWKKNNISYVVIWRYL